LSKSIIKLKQLNLNNLTLISLLKKIESWYWDFIDTDMGFGSWCVTILEIIQDYVLIGFLKAGQYLISRNDVIY